MRGPNRLIAQCWITAAWLAATGPAPGAVPTAHDGGPTIAAARARLAAASVPFVESDGSDRAVRFEARLLDGMLQVTEDAALVYTLGTRSRVLVERFPGGAARPQAGLPHTTRVARFIGDDASLHRANLRTYEHVSLGEVFPGVDVRLRATGSNVEKIFTVRPGARPAAIRVALEGAAALRIGGDGALHATLDGGDIAFTAPVAYQTIDGRPSPVPVRYALDASGRGYRFAVGRYDRTRPLVIDPLLQSTYLGGNSGDTLRAIAVHPVSGEIVVVGDTGSTNIACTVAGGGCANGAQTAHASDAGSRDVLVARLSADLTQLKQATYLGGNQADLGSAIALNVAGNEVIVAGSTFSTNFPCVSNATAGCANGGQSAFGGFRDGFVARLSGDLTQLKQASYYGGSNDDSATALAVHPLSGEIYIAGFTLSTNLPCTTTGGVCANGAQTAHAADGALGSDGFVARFSPDLTQLRQGTYFGGTGFEGVNALAIHPATGEIYIAGSTDSTNLACTTSSATCANGAQPHLVDSDGYLARLSADLTQIRQATYLGGHANDVINAMAVHPFTGEVIVAGTTSAVDFPCTSPGGYCKNGAQISHAGDSGSTDGFVARLSPSLTQLRQATYAGGNGADALKALAIHPASGEIFVAGNTTSSGLACTTAGGVCGNAAIGAIAAGQDAYIVRFSADLTQYRQATYYGGNGDDSVFALAIHPASGEAILGGDTLSTNLPCTTAGGLCANGAQQANASSPTTTDGFLARFNSDLTLTDSTPAPFAFLPANNAPLSTLTMSAPVQITGIFGSVPVYIEGPAGVAYCISLGSNCSCDANGAFTAAPGTINNNQFVCARHVSPPAGGFVNESVFHVAGSAASFRVATAGVSLGAGGNCTLDADGNGVLDALTDGLILLRAMFGLTGTAVTNGAIGGGATRNTWALIQPFLNGNCGTSFAP